MKQSRLNSSEAMSHNYTFIQTYKLRRFHPKRLVIDAVGWIWGFYLLWRHDWYGALLTFAAFTAFSLWCVRHVDPRLMARTALGRIGLLHSRPLNLLLQGIGAACVLFGIYMHDTVAILEGFSAILMGHFFGWGKVHAALSVRPPIGPESPAPVEAGALVGSLRRQPARDRQERPAAHA